MRVKIFYHDHCFDGACSAAVFACFYRRAFDAQTEFSYAGLMHRPGAVLARCSLMLMSMPSSISSFIQVKNHLVV